MRFVTPSFDFTDNSLSESIFSERKNFAHVLTQLVSVSSEPLVISIDGKWGEGKTTFVKMWQTLLNQSNIPNIYIDAFAIDYIDDPFISIVSVITDYAEKNIITTEQQRIVDLKKKSREIGCKLLSFTSRVAVKSFTLGIIKDADIEMLSSIKDDLSKTASGFVGDFIEERINSHAKDVLLIDSFKNILSELPAKLNNVDNKPLVIIIDELDRCKPTFAVELLEKIKHIFSVNNVVFILVINKKQLEQSIQTIYGQNIDAHSYLQKFINIETKLPKNIIEPYNNDVHKYIKCLFELHDLPRRDETKNLLDSLEVLSIHLNLSLRQLEKVFTNLTIYYSVSTDSELNHPYAMAFLSVVKVFDPNLFDVILHHRSAFSVINTSLNLDNINRTLPNASLILKIKEFIKQCLMTNEAFDSIQNKELSIDFRSLLNQYGINRQDILIYTANKISLLTFNYF